MKKRTDAKPTPRRATMKREAMPRCIADGRVIPMGYIHPSKLPTGESEAWISLTGTVGDRLHILDSRDPQTVVTLCGKNSGPDNLRGCPSIEIYPGARACPLCVKVYEEINR